MQNVDPNELSKFEKLASRWWDPNSEFRPLHQINPLRLNYIEEQVCLQNKKVIDIGCGGGILSESMWERGASVTGVDAGQGPISVARLHARERSASIDYRQGTVEELIDHESGQYDVVTCMELLEHVPSPAETISACAKLTRTGGHVFFSTINRNPKSWLFAIVGAEYVLNLLPRGTHHYEKFIKPSEVDLWARDAGLYLSGSIGLHYNPIFQKYSLGGNLDVNYILHFRHGSLTVHDSPGL